MQILRYIQSILGRPSAANFLAPVQRFSSSSRPRLAFTASAPPRWFLQSHARPVPLVMAPSNRHVSRFSHGSQNVALITQDKGNESCKIYRRLSVSSNSGSSIPQGSEHSAINQSMKNIEMDNSKEIKNIERTGTISEFIDEDERSDKDACRSTVDVVNGNCDKWEQKDEMAKDGVTEEEVSDDEGYPVNKVLARSRHRDSSIYKGMDLWWKKEYHVADRNETRLEAMMLSDPTNCYIRDGICMEHCAGRMLQIFSLELAEIFMDGGVVELYGYMAVRDSLDPLLNYVFNFNRDNPIIVEQGSLINMVGPKRGIELLAPVLIEYDMRIKTNEQENNDLQLIDGASVIGNFGSWDKPCKIRIPGDCGAIDITFARIGNAVEGTVQMFIWEVRSIFNLSLYCLTSGLDKEISLFDGAITESCALKRFVIAVKRNSLIDLKLEMGTLSSTSDQYRCCFEAKVHGHDIQNIQTSFALVLVKVTWSTLPSYFSDELRC